MGGNGLPNVDRHFDIDLLIQLGQGVLARQEVSFVSNGRAGRRGFSISGHERNRPWDLWINWDKQLAG
jgi:hypothetical protein